MKIKIFLELSKKSDKKKSKYFNYIEISSKNLTLTKMLLNNKVHNLYAFKLIKLRINKTYTL